ncbi:MAG: cell wall-active antibiotics response protein [Bacteroidales bacterium]|jgi:predicted membrane protein|nr:cell wall-active antibiotics response protein [Bacteroidales bacterium]
MKTRINIGSLIFGLLTVGAGICLFAFNTNLLPQQYKTVVFSWPMLMVAIGFSVLFMRNRWRTGVILMLAGVVFLFPKLQHVMGRDFDAQSNWPVILVVAGLVILFKSVYRHRFVRWHMKKHEQFGCNRKAWHDYMKEKCQHRSDTGYIDRNQVFGSLREKIDVQDFKGGDINCVFGGIELDLSDAKLADGIHTLEINTVFGGVNIYVPIDWKIEIRKDQIFGHFVDNRPTPNFEVNENTLLVLEVSAVFGGGEIRCK